MQTKLILLFLLANLFCRPGYSQKNSFFLLPQLGLLNGDGHVNASVLVSGGMEVAEWQYGIATGFDYYKFRSVPVYAEVRRFIGRNRKKPFLYAAAGWNIAFPLEEQNHYYNGWWGGNTDKSDFDNGYILEGGAGIFLSNKKGKGLILSAGYSTKTLGESWMENNWNPENNSWIMTSHTNRYTLNRIQLKAGFRIF